MGGPGPTLAALWAQQPQSGQAPPAPGTTPPQAPPSAGGMQDYANLAAQQQQQLLSSAPAQEAATARAAGPKIAEQISQTPLPQMAPQIDRNKGFLHNLGQALQIISMATPAGRTVFGPSGPIYGPKIASYKATQAGLMGQKESAETQATQAGQEVGQLAGVAGRTIMGGGKVEAAKISADQKASAAVLNHQAAMARIAQSKDIAQMRIDAQKELMDMKNDVLVQLRGMQDVTQEDVARIMTSGAQTLLNTKLGEDPSFLGWAKRELGITSVQAPGGQPPVTGEAPPPKRAPGKPAAKAGPPPGATHIGTGRDKKDHYLDAQGKDLGLVK